MFKSIRAFFVVSCTLHLLSPVSAGADQPPASNTFQAEEALATFLRYKEAIAGSSKSQTSLPRAVHEYGKVLSGRIKESWGWKDKTAPLVAVVQLEIGSDGTLGSVSVKSPSGNSEFDESAIAAVRKAAPFPTPPKEHYHQYLKTLQITFDPRE